MKTDLLSIIAFIEEEKTYLLKSGEINIQLWPIHYHVNGDETMSFEDAVERMKSSYNTRIQKLDNIINNM